MATKDFKVKNGLQVTEKLQVGGNTDISGNAAVTGKLSVNSAASFANTVGIEGALTVNNSITLGNNSNQTLTVTAGLASNLIPSTTNVVALGSSSKLFKELHLSDTLFVGGNTSINGTLVVNNDVTIGNSTTQTLTVVAGLAANLLPSSNNTVSLGSDTKRFKDLYLSSGTLYVGNVSLSDTANELALNANLAVDSTHAVRVGEIAVINSTAISVGANVTANATTIKVGDTTINTGVVSLGGRIVANGSSGTAGHFLRTGGSGANAYYSGITLGTDTDGDYVATITAGIGLVGSANGEGSTPTIAVVANNGIIANDFGVFVRAGDAISVNATGVHVVSGDGLTTNSSAVYVNANNGIVANASGLFVKAGTGVVVNSEGVHIGQAIGTTSDVQFANITATGTANLAYANIVNNAFIGGTLTVGNNVTISGNLIVTGDTTYVNTTVLAVSDNKVLLNADLGAVAPTESAGIEVNRGTSANVFLQYNETQDRWEFTNDGSNYHNLPLSSEYNNYTYSVDSPANTTTGVIRLARNDNSNDDIIIIGAGGTSVSSNGTHIEITSSSTANAIQSIAIEQNATLVTDDQTIQADTVTDTLTFVAGYGIQVNTDSTNDKILVSRKGYKNGDVLLTTSGTEYTVDTATSLKALKYLIHATDGTDHHASEVLVVAKTGDDAYLTEYGIIHTSASPLVTLAVTLTGGNPVLKATPSTNSVTLKYQRIDLQAINS